MTDNRKPCTESRKDLRKYRQDSEAAIRTTREDDDHTKRLGKTSNVDMVALAVDTSKAGCCVGGKKQSPSP